MSTLRFRPSLESLDQRLNPSSTAPAIVTVEYIILAHASAPMHDDVVVDGKIITGQDYDYHPLPKPVRLLDTRAAAGPNETISIDVNRTELLVPAVQKVREAAARM